MPTKKTPKSKPLKSAVSAYKQGSRFGFRLWAYGTDGVAVFLEMSGPAYENAILAELGGDRRRKELALAFGWEPGR